MPSTKQDLTPGRHEAVMPLAGGQEFGSSVNPIITRGASPPGFENLAASLRRKLTVKVVASYQGHLHTRTKSNSFIFQLKYHGHHKRQDQLALGLA